MPAPKSPAEYAARARAVHGARYTYELSTLRRLKEPATIICPDHGPFQQNLGNHLQGAGCPQCAGRGVDWVARFRAVHGDLYDYRDVVFVGYKTPVRIHCPAHGAFLQSPDNHYRGKQGCPRCKGERIRRAKQLPVAEFIRRARLVHGELYGYALEQFPNVLTGKVAITCPLHGVFMQSPVNHLAGKVGCTRCNHMKSQGEDAVFRLVSRAATALQRDRSLLRPKELDIYLPEKRLAIEYCGDYWHSHGDPDSERRDRGKHYEKYLACQAQGVRLLTIYESEWLSRRGALRRLIRTALGQARGRVMARKCTLGTPTAAQAREFYERYHPQGGAGAGEHYGLYWRGKLVACMRFSFGANDRGAAAVNRVWTLTRYATRVTVAGGASRLFKAFVQEHAPAAVKSFSDNRYFAGGMYEQLGFRLEGETAPDYQVWSPVLGLLPKTRYQRRVIPDRLKEHGVDEVFDPETDPRTEADMTYLMGCRRLYDCGKRRWIWTS